MVKRYKQTNTRDDNDGEKEEAAAASQNRKRNRIAAVKCRLKKKIQVSRLAEDERKAEEENAYLSSQVSELKEEVLSLKSEILRHAQCDCPLIDAYISNQASHVLHSQLAGASGVSADP